MKKIYEYKKLFLFRSSRIYCSTQRLHFKANFCKAFSVQSFANQTFFNGNLLKGRKSCRQSEASVRSISKANSALNAIATNIHWIIYRQQRLQTSYATTHFEVCCMHNSPSMCSERSVCKGRQQVWIALRLSNGDGFPTFTNECLASCQRHLLITLLLFSLVRSQIVSFAPFDVQWHTNRALSEESNLFPSLVGGVNGNSLSIGCSSVRWV